MTVEISKTHVFNVELKLSPNKQRVLIEMLITRCGYRPECIARLIGASLEDVVNVFNGVVYFNKAEAERLVKAFCRWC